MSSPTEPAVNRRPAMAILFLTVVIDLIGFGIVLPLLPSYAAGFHAGDAAIGLLVASFSFMQFIFAPRWGRLSDRIGRRPVLLLGLCGSAASYLLFALAGNYWVLLLSRLLAGGMGATVNVAQAYLADITPPDRRSHAMGLIGAAFGLGFVLGPAIAGLTVHFGQSVPGFVAAGISAGALLLAFIRLPETRVHQPSGVARGALHWRPLAPSYGVLFFAVLAFAVISVALPLYTTRDLGYSEAQTAHLFVLMGLASAVVQGWLVGKLSRRFPERSLIRVGTTLLAAGLAGIPISHFAAVPAFWHVPLLLVSIVVLAVGVGLNGPSVTGYLSRMVGRDEQGRALGTLQSVNSMARILGPPGAGLVMAGAGTAVAFFAAGAMALVALGISLLGMGADPL